MAIVDKTQMLDAKHESLSAILIRCVQLFENNNHKEKLISENELDYILDKIKSMMND